MSHLTHIQQIGNMTCVTHNKAINKKIKKFNQKNYKGQSHPQQLINEHRTHHM